MNGMALAANWHEVRGSSAKRAGVAADYLANRAGVAADYSCPGAQFRAGLKHQKKRC